MSAARLNTPIPAIPAAPARATAAARSIVIPPIARTGSRTRSQTRAQRVETGSDVPLGFAVGREYRSEQQVVAPALGLDVGGFLFGMDRSADKEPWRSEAPYARGAE